MDLGIRGKVAWVTGSSAGMGKATALSLAREGAKLALCSRSQENLEAAARQIREATGVDPFVHVADVTDEKAVQGFAEAAERGLGPPDILVNNAGGPPPGGFQDTPTEAWEKAHRLTLQSAISFCREVVPGMKQRRWGRIVTITSLTVKQPIETLLLSNTYRAGLTAFMKSLAGEVAPFGVTVNCICPGYTATERLNELAQAQAAKRNITAAQVRQEWEKSIPAGRLGRPEEIADFIAFVASDRAGYLTGASILVDGGHVRALV
jgi:3-oxoacyl-[acyl-carrier protein] reductase